MRTISSRAVLGNDRDCSLRHAAVSVRLGSSQPQSRQFVAPPPDVAAPPAGSLKTTSGLSTLVLQPGTGTRHPRASDRVTVHYTGWTTDGKMFDSSVPAARPRRLR